MTHTHAGRILVVDDHAEMASGLASYLGDHGYVVETAAGGAAALTALESSAFDAVITDLRMREVDGLEVLAAARRLDATLPVFIMTGYGSIETAIDAIRRGAYHYFSKPLKVEEVLIYLERALAQRTNELTRQQLLRDVRERYTFESMVGRSAPMRRLFDLIDRVAGTSASILVRGESGTGKELVARAIHFRGPRAGAPFVPLNCAAVPATLIESELFGHESGAFTGATKPRAGLAAEAHGGTLFLDEVGELPLELQPKLLRLLQEGEVRPVGSDKIRRVDVRIVAATNVDLDDAVRAGRFRADLFYRLSVVPMEVPPLRERQDDIPVLAERMLERLVDANPQVTARRFSPDAIALLDGCAWPGNVRELDNAIARAATLCRGDTLEAEDFAFLRTQSSPGSGLVGPEEELTLRELEQRYIEHVLARVGGNKVKAAAILGVDPSTLYRRRK